MGASCSIDCYVKNPEGKVVESNLWKDLKLHLPSRNLAKEFYGTATDKKFVEQLRKNEEIRFDRNGEVTFNSLRKVLNLDISDEVMLEKLNKEIKAGTMDYGDAVRRLVEFNQDNRYAEDFLATMIPSVESPGRYDLSVVKRDASSEINLEQTLEDWNLISEIMKVLTSKGVAVDFLQRGQKEYNGRYSTINAKKTADGFHSLIQVALGNNIADHLAEEAGHFAVGSLGDSPLVKRLEALVSDPEVQREILGEEYDTRNMGTSATREVAGTLVGRALVNKEHSKSAWSKLADRIASLAKSIYAKFTGNEALVAKLRAENIAKNIARQFMTGENYTGSVENALQMKEELYNAELNTNGAVFREVAGKLDVAITQLRALGTNELLDDFKVMTGKVVSGRTQYIEKAGDIVSGITLEGIAEAMDLLRNKIGPGKEFNKLLESIDFYNDSNFYENMSTYANNLRQVRTVVEAINEILKEVNTNFSQLKGDLTNIELVDSKGVPYKVDLRSVKESLDNLNGKLLTDLQNKEMQFFVRVCEDIVGTKYIWKSARAIWNITEKQKLRNSTKGWNVNESVKKDEYEDYKKKASKRKEKTDKKIAKYEKLSREGRISESQKAKLEELKKFKVLSYDEWLSKGVKKGWVFSAEKEKITFEQAIRALDTDISLFEKWLGSMSNNSDIIGQVMDKAVKMANKIADDNVNKVQESLITLHTRFTKIKNVKTGKNITTEELYEKDENGNYTGNIVSDLDWGKWENDWKEFYDYHRKKFDEQWKDKGITEIEKAVKWENYFKTSYKKWHDDNSTYDEDLHRYVPSILNYESKQLSELKSKYGEEFTNWYNDYIELKNRLDACLPAKSNTPVRLPQFKGRYTNIISNFRSTRQGVGHVMRMQLSETFCESSEDTDYGSEMTYNSEAEMLHADAIAMQKERINRLPLYGVRKLSNMKELSTDIFGSTLAYAGMAFSYDALNTVADAAEVGKSVLYNQRKVEGQWESNRARDKGGSSNSYSRYIKFLDKQVYGINSGKHKFTSLMIIREKLAAFATRMGSIWFLGGNVIGGMVNTGTGFIELLKEAGVGEFIDIKHFTKAHGMYWGSFMSNAFHYGNEFKNDKVSLFVRHFNTIGENKLKQREWDTKDPKLRKIMNMFKNSLFLPYKTGDHYMHTIAYLANADKVHLYHADGSNLSLYNAFQKVSIVGDELRDLLRNTTKVDQMKAKGKNLVDLSLLKNEKDYDDFVSLNELIVKYEDIENNQPLTAEEKKLLKKYKIDTNKNDRGIINSLVKAADSMVRNKYTTATLQRQPAMTLRMMGTYFKSKDGKKEYLRLRELSRKVRNANQPLASGNILTEEDRKALEEMDINPADGPNAITALENKAKELIWQAKDESSFMDTQREILIRMHGIYNNQDKTAASNDMYANMWLSMKGYALGMIERRFGRDKYSITLGKEVEGNINTAAKILLARRSGLSFWRRLCVGARMLSGINMNCFNLGLRSDKTKMALKRAGFSNNQVYNMVRTQYDSLIQVMLYFIIESASAMKPDDDDDEDANIWYGRLYYFANRWLREQMAFSNILGLRAEALTLMNFVPAGGSALFDMGKLAYEWSGGQIYDEDDEEYSDFFYGRSEPYKYDEGEAKWKVHLRRNLPYIRSYYAWMSPWKAWKNYEYGTTIKR